MQIVDEIYKVTSISLSPNVLGQICVSRSKTCEQKMLIFIIILYYIYIFEAIILAFVLLISFR